MKKTMHCYVTGRVQGVWFRASTQEQAVLYGLTGWVQNLPDGRVEVMASGAEEQVNLLRKWLTRGPELAHVMKVECEEVEYLDYDRFSVR
jgi:acylphosphatase